ncbi:hypothetical protein [Pseudomonas putida]|uniref:hypothetical protein n=1 Tax=Pseudomonas putida TaxID=303 RepID=UPI003D9683AF
MQINEIELDKTSIKSIGYIKIQTADSKMETEHAVLYLQPKPGEPDVAKGAVYGWSADKQDTVSISFPETSGDGKFTYHYKRDFGSQEMRWGFKIGDIVKVADSGEITIEFKHSKNNAEGTFKFFYDKTKEATGTFKLERR